MQYFTTVAYFSGSKNKKIEALNNALRHYHHMLVTSNLSVELLKDEIMELVLKLNNEHSRSKLLSYQSYECKITGMQHILIGYNNDKTASITLHQVNREI